MNNYLGGHTNKSNIEIGSLNYILKNFKIKNLIDIGCGPGDMKSVIDKFNIEYTGIEGDKTCIENKPYIINHDFRNYYESEKIYDLGYSVEFLEHVEEEYCNNYMALFKNCKYILITAAPPKWPGHHHVNCKNHEYWIRLFNKYGFVFDPFNTFQIRNHSTMNLNRGNNKKFIKHRALFFINSKFVKINFINSEPFNIKKNHYFKFKKYKEIEIPINNTNQVSNTNNYLFKSTLPLISYIL